MSATKERLLEQLGFRFGTNGPHAARTMMLDDLRVLFSHAPADGARSDYTQSVCTANVLGKPTKKSRELALQHLTTLYGLDTQLPLCRALRRLWQVDVDAQPVWALSAAEVEQLLVEKLKSDPVAL